MHETEVLANFDPEVLILTFSPLYYQRSYLADFCTIEQLRLGFQPVLCSGKPYPYLILDTHKNLKFNALDVLSNDSCIAFKSNNYIWAFLFNI